MSEADVFVALLGGRETTIGGWHYCRCPVCGRGSLGIRERAARGRSCIVCRIARGTTSCSP